MQGDLISRSEFKKKLVDYNRHLIAREEKATEEEDYEELNAICYERRAYFMLLSFLDDMPCAFDVEAVTYSHPNGYAAVLYGISSMSVYHEGKEVMHTGFRNVNTEEAVMELLETMPEALSGGKEQP